MTSTSDDLAALGGKPDTVSVPPMLLVSVRDRAEMAAALTAGADIIDLKEPRHGALAPADAELWQCAASMWSRLGSTPSPLPAIPSLSAALGERTDAVILAPRLPKEFSFAKVGPLHCDSVATTRDLWTEVRQRLDDRIELVAVAYADSHNARCMHPEAIFHQAIDAGFRRCLIDTWTKDGRSTLDHLGLSGLSRLGDLAREAGIWWALAGSIRADYLAELWQSGVEPDCFGVRGDVCLHGRTGILSMDRIKVWQESLIHRRPR